MTNDALLHLTAAARRAHAFFSVGLHSLDPGDPQDREAYEQFKGELDALGRAIEESKDVEALTESVRVVASIGTRAADGKGASATSIVVVGEPTNQIERILTQVSVEALKQGFTQASTQMQMLGLTKPHVTVSGPEAAILRRQFDRGGPMPLPGKPQGN